MKILTKILLALVVVTSLTFAVEALTLKSNMKQIGSIYKQISASIADSSKNTANAEATGKMIDFLNATKTQSPDIARVTEFQDLINQAITNATDLKKALLNNDTAGAQAALMKINTIKKEGHDKFD